MSILFYLPCFLKTLPAADGYISNHLFSLKNMALLDNLFGKKEETQKTFDIDITPDGIVLNGQQLPFPVKLAYLQGLFGEATLFKGEHSQIYTWHELGIHGFLEGEMITELDIQVLKVRESNFLPRRAFAGTLKINGVDYQKYIKLSAKDYLYKDYTIGDFNVSAGLTEDEPKQVWSITIDKPVDEEPSPEDKGKYAHQAINGEKINFADFNFKLLVIEELMYNQEVLTPKFDVYEFARLYDKRKIDIDEEGYEPIAEVAEYFKNLEVDKALALLVTELYQDGGNHVYLAICPFWDGEDDLFDIDTYKDTEHFPNLKKMTIMSNDTGVFDELNGKGIEAVAV